MYSTKVAGVWSQAAKLTASGGGAFDYFGHSVAVDGETIVIGARGHGSSPGAAYVFTEPSNGWGHWSNLNADGKADLTATLTASNADDDDQFGQSVAVDGATVVVGAEQDDETKGSAYVFTKPTGDNWADNTETARLAASDRGASDSFGASVAIRGSTIVVGAYYADIDECDESEDDCDDDPRSGAAYLFTKPANVDWANDPNKDYRTESGKLTLPTEEGAVEKYDEFGNSVALDGQSIVVGAPEGNDDFGLRVGHPTVGLLGQRSRDHVRHRGRPALGHRSGHAHAGARCADQLFRNRSERQGPARLGRPHRLQHHPVRVPSGQR